MRSLRKRALAKELGQQYKTTKNGCMITDKYGSTEFPHVIPNSEFLQVVKMHVKVN